MFEIILIALELILERKEVHYESCHQFDRK